MHRLEDLVYEGRQLPFANLQNLKEGSQKHVEGGHH